MRPAYVLPFLLTAAAFVVILACLVELASRPSPIWDHSPAAMIRGGRA